jgi:6-phosphogluconolactonase
MGSRCVGGLAFCLGLIASSISSAEPQFLYANDNTVPNTVSAYSIEADGSLAPLAGSPFETLGSGRPGTSFIAAETIVIDPGRSHLHAANNGSGDISSFAVDSATGHLERLAAAPFAIPGDGGISLAMTPDGRFLIVGRYLTEELFVLAIGTDGSLEPEFADRVRIERRPGGMQVTPKGRFLIVATGGEDEQGVYDGALEVFLIGTEGRLEPVPGSPFPDSSRGNAASVAVSCSGERLFVGEGNSIGVVVSTFDIDESGALHPTLESPFTARPSEGAGVNSAVVKLAPGERHLFVSNSISGSVTVVEVDADGSLGPLAGPRTGVGAGRSAYGIASGRRASRLFVASAPDYIDVFDVGSDGSLATAAGSPFANGRSFQLVWPAVFPPARACEVEVAVDIKPGQKLNAIHPGSRGVVAVALLGSESFDAAQIDATTLRFGPEGAAPVHAFGPHDADVNGDGWPDRVSYFRTRETGIAFGDVDACVDGTTHTGTPFFGCDAIRTVPRCGKGLELALAAPAVLALVTRSRRHATRS